MFRILKIAAVFVMTAVLPVVSHGQGVSCRLPTEVEALRGELLEIAVWDFSQQWLVSDKGQSRICNYGDTLLAETVEGRRYWYVLRQDTILYKGEEDRLTVIDLDPAVMIGRRPVAAGFSSGKVTFAASGTGGGRRFRICEVGTIDYATSARTGTLIVASGDTLDNVIAARELRCITATFPDDSASVATSAVIETYRWYDTDGQKTLMPVALQRSVYRSVSGAMPTEDAQPSFAMAYLPDRNEIIGSNKNKNDRQMLPEQADLEAVAQALGAATVYCDGRAVRVDVAMPDAGLTVTVDIMDAGGRLYLHESTVSSGATDEIVLDCSSLRSGEYIAAIGVEGLEVSPEKRLVIIR